MIKPPIRHVPGGIILLKSGARLRRARLAVKGLPSWVPDRHSTTAGRYAGGSIFPVAGYTDQSIAWASKPVYEAQIQYGF